MVSISRSATSTLPLCLATKFQMSSRSAAASGASRCAIGGTVAGSPWASVRRGLPGGEAGAAALLYLRGELAHRPIRDGASFASGERRLGLVHGGEDVGAGALACL